MTLFLVSLFLKSAGICLLGIVFLAVLHRRESSLKRATLWATAGLLLLSPAVFLHATLFSVPAPSWVASASSHPDPGGAPALSPSLENLPIPKKSAYDAVDSSIVGDSDGQDFEALSEDRPIQESSSASGASVAAPTSSGIGSPNIPGWAWLWLGGIFALLLRFVVGYATARKLAAGTVSASDEAHRLLGLLRIQLGVRRKVALLAGSSVGPATVGIFRPVIILPDGYEEWPVERLQAVLAHELSHIRQWDLLLLSLIVLARAVFWLNPLAWILAAKSRWYIEESADDLVLQNGFYAPDYAAELLSFARNRQRTRTFALTMASPPALEKRIRRVLDPRVSRRQPNLLVRASLFAAIALLAIPCLAISAIQAQAPAPPYPASPVAVAAPQLPRAARGHRNVRHARPRHRIGRTAPIANRPGRVPRSSSPSIGFAAGPSAAAPQRVGPGQSPRSPMPFRNGIPSAPASGVPPFGRGHRPGRATQPGAAFAAPGSPPQGVAPYPGTASAGPAGAPPQPAANAATPRVPAAGTGIGPGAGVPSSPVAQSAGTAPQQTLPGSLGAPVAAPQATVGTGAMPSPGAPPSAPAIAAAGMPMAPPAGFGPSTGPLPRASTPYRNSTPGTGFRGQTPASAYAAPNRPPTAYAAPKVNYSTPAYYQQAPQATYAPNRTENAESIGQLGRTVAERRRTIGWRRARRNPARPNTTFSPGKTSGSDSCKSQSRVGTNITDGVARGVRRVPPGQISCAAPQDSLFASRC